MKFKLTHPFVENQRSGGKTKGNLSQCSHFHNHFHHCHCLEMHNITPTVLVTQENGVVFVTVK